MGEDQIVPLSPARGGPGHEAAPSPSPVREEQADLAYDAVKQRIQKGDLAPGQRITEKGLVAVTGLGKTPVREALGRLVTEGLVDVIPRSGYRVRQLTLQDVDEIFECWRIVWPAIAVLAAQRITPAERQALRSLASDEPDAAGIEAARRFTEFVVAAARNGRLAAMAARLIEDLERLFYLVLRRTDVVLRFPGPEAELFRAFDERDEAGIRESIATWVDGAYANVLAAVHRFESLRNAPLT